MSLSGVLAGAERLKTMPVPCTCTLILHLTACLFLPFGLDALGHELENPFGSGQNALPLSAMPRGMEIDVHEMLGDAVLPDPLRPVDVLLT